MLDLEIKYVRYHGNFSWICKCLIRFEKGKNWLWKYYISRAELIDYEMFEYDMEREFIEELKKYGDDCQNE